MRPFYRIVSAVALYSTALGALPALCREAPKVVLTGTVSDAIDNSTVDSADISVRDPTGGLITKVITGTDGKYIVPNLKSGDTVIIYYAHSGYLPHPSGPVKVILSKKKNTTNLQLMKDSKFGLLVGMGKSK